MLGKPVGKPNKTTENCWENWSNKAKYGHQFQNFQIRPLPLRATGLWGVSRVAIGCKIVYCRESAIFKSLIGFNKCTHAPTGSVSSMPRDWQNSTATEMDSAGISASLNTFSRSSFLSCTLWIQHTVNGPKLFIFGLSRKITRFMKVRLICLIFL